MHQQRLRTSTLFVGSLRALNTDKYPKHSLPRSQIKEDPGGLVGCDKSKFELIFVMYFLENVILKHYIEVIVNDADLALFVDHAFCNPLAVNSQYSLLIVSCFPAKSLHS